jgi:hypothetical protein
VAARCTFMPASPLFVRSVIEPVPPIV